MSSVIAPGAQLGVLGSGQLGRMFAIAARRLGYRVTTLSPDRDTPTGQVADREIEADYHDADRVEEFARSVDVVTFEFENVPVATAEIAARHAPVRPVGNALYISQDRIREKRFLSELGLPVAPFQAIESKADLERVQSSWSFEAAILKTAAWGYDGKGQIRIGKRDELAPAWTSMGQPVVLERVVPFRGELSIVAARGLDGSVALYEPVWNTHVDGILDTSTCPAPVAPKIAGSAADIARTILEGLDYVGVLCVEMFLLESDELVVNEIAPRPHNSGHLTIDGHSCCQFEQQVRAVCGLPLGTTERLAPGVAMANLLGEVWSGGAPRWENALASEGVRLHLYGKSEPRPGRKMGHLTATADQPEAACERVRAARDSVGVATAPQSRA